MRTQLRPSSDISHKSFHPCNFGSSANFNTKCVIGVSNPFGFRFCYITTNPSTSKRHHQTSGHVTGKLPVSLQQKFCFTSDSSPPVTRSRIPTLNRTANVKNDATIMPSIIATAHTSDAQQLVVIMPPTCSTSTSSTMATSTPSLAQPPAGGPLALPLLDINSMYLGTFLETFQKTVNTGLSFLCDKLLIQKRVWIFVFRSWKRLFHLQALV